MDPLHAHPPPPAPPSSRAALETRGQGLPGASGACVSCLPPPSPHLHGGGSSTSGRPMEVSGRAQQQVRGGPVSALAVQAGNRRLSASVLLSSGLRARPSLGAGLGAEPRGQVTVSSQEARAGGWAPSPR